MSQRCIRADVVTGAAKDFKEFYQTAIQMGQRRTASQNEVRKRLERVGNLKELMSKWMLQQLWRS